MQNHSASTNQQ